MTWKQLFLAASIVLLTLAAQIGIALWEPIWIDVGHYLSPALAALAIFLLFSMILRWQVGDNLFGELGFLYLGLALAYTALPAAAFIAIGLDDASLLAQLLPSPEALGNHLWRHVLFLFSVATGYLLVRGRSKLQQVRIIPTQRDHFTIAFLIVMTAVTILFLSLLSAPVESYYDSYIRYDHLPSWLRRVAAVFIRLNFGIYVVLLVFLFVNYKKFKLVIPVIVVTICLYETIHTFGSRINAFVILLSTAWLYHMTVRAITIKKWLVIGAGLICVFSVVELVRPLDTNQVAAQEVLLEEGFKPPSELGAVFLTSFHLYDERSRGSLPPTEWPMLFSDFISLVPFTDFKGWEPMDWYTRNYYPDALFPPLTLGPIADSAIWGGELDLLLRGLINGFFFAYLVRWFSRRDGAWWEVTIYVYCYASAVMTLKYSIFFILTPLLKTVVPTLLLVGAVRQLVSLRRASPTPELGVSSQRNHA
jgi:hypothetical protein